MAAVTINGPIKYNVNGSLRDQYYNITGATGDTLTVGMTTVRQVNVEPATITGYSVAAGPNPGQSVITFTTGGGAFTATDVQVLGN